MYFSNKKYHNKLHLKIYYFHFYFNVFCFSSIKEKYVSLNKYIWFQGPNIFDSRDLIYLIPGTKYIWFQGPNIFDSRDQIYLIPGTEYIWFQGPNIFDSRDQIYLIPGINIFDSRDKSLMIKGDMAEPRMKFIYPTSLQEECPLFPYIILKEMKS